MKTKITSLCFAIALFLSSCGKEHFSFTNTGTSYGSKKASSEATVAANDQAITAEDAATPEELAKAPVTLSANTGNTVALSKKDFTKAKPLYHAPVATPVQTEEVSKVAQAKAAIKVNKQIKAIVKEAKKKDVAGTAAEGKSQIVAAVLAFFLGGFGVHRFYLGYTTKGILQLAGTLVGAVLSPFIIGIPILLAVFIWVIVDFVRILTGGLQPKNGNYTSEI